MSKPDDSFQVPGESRLTVIRESKQVLKNGILRYSVTIENHNGSGYTLEAFGEEARNLEKEVEKRKSYEESAGVTPKIFLGGNGSPDQPPASAGCTNQVKSAGLPGDLKDKSKAPGTEQKSKT